jgi:hypothetical protein
MVREVSQHHYPGMVSSCPHPALGPGKARARQGKDKARARQGKRKSKGKGRQSRVRGKGKGKGQGMVQLPPSCLLVGFTSGTAEVGLAIGY